MTHAAYETPLFSPGDPLVCRSIQLRPSLWAVLFNELQRLGEEWQWRQDDPTHATVGEVTGEISAATDSAVLAGCLMLAELKWIGRAVPDWCLLCDGAEYDRVDYPDLYAVIDDIYKTSADTFVVPDLIGRTVRGAIVPGGEGGADSVTLTETELPAHAHGLHAHSAHTHGVSPDLEGAGVPDLSAGPPVPSSTGTASVDSTGDGEAFSIVNPYHGHIPVWVAKYPGAV